MLGQTTGGAKDANPKNDQLQAEITVFIFQNMSMSTLWIQREALYLIHKPCITTQSDIFNTDTTRFMEIDDQRMKKILWSKLTLVLLIFYSGETSHADKQKVLFSADEQYEFETKRLAFQLLQDQES